MKPVKRLIMGTSLLFGLTACVPSAYVRPTVPMPASFVHAGNPDALASPPADWWTAFGDPVLSALVADVRLHNNDLAAAAVRVRQAQLQAGLAHLDQLPSASGGIGATSSSQTSYSASLEVSYEVDLWGRLSAATRAANWETLATEEDRKAAELALIGTTCELYWRLGYTRQQISAGEQDLIYAKKVRDLVNVQHSAGAVSGIEVSEAAQSVSAQEANLATLRQQLVIYRAGLGVVLGGYTWSEDSATQGLPQVALPEVHAGLPADLLSRRPDLRAAEMRLRETLAGVDIAKASLYPGLSLTAAGGASSSDLGQVLSHPTGSLAAALSLPLLDFARLHTNIRVSQAAYEIAVLSFKTTLLQALADTDNALSDRTQLAEAEQSQRASLAAARKAESLYAIRYKTGSVALRVWLDAQASLRQSQLSYDNIRLSQLINQSTLYQALGGGA